MLLSKANLFIRPVGRSNAVVRSPSSVPLLRISRSAIKAQPNDDDDDCNYIASDTCGIDPETGKMRARRTVGEMEQEFLQALSSYYFDGKAMINDEEFNLLKEVSAEKDAETGRLELLWSGSSVAILDKEEQMFLEASMCYNKDGTKLMGDEEYDALKAKLRTKGSVAAAEGPRCSLRSKTMYSDASPDYLKMTLLNLPAVLVVLGAIFAVDFITDFKITTALELPPPYGVGLLWGIVLPLCFVIANSITDIAFKNFIILKAACPNCGTENSAFFGDVMTVAGTRDTNTSDCKNCNALLTFDENKRIVAVSETPEDRKAKADEKQAALAAKKAAATAAMAKRNAEAK
eukprot:gene19317-25969_t